MKILANLKIASFSERGAFMERFETIINQNKQTSKSHINPLDFSYPKNIKKTSFFSITPQQIFFFLFPSFPIFLSNPQ
jgi:hypothetical protein